jgi:hypothetical protein
MARVTSESTTAPVAPDPATAPAPVRRWWQRLPFLVLVGVLPLPFGLFFLGFIAIALLLSDATRESEVRAGGGVLLLWWEYSFREGETTPYVGAVMLAIAAVLLALGARRRLAYGGVRAAWGPLGGTLLAAALGVVVLVPYGYRQPEVTREAAARRVFEERAARPWKVGRATDYLVDPGRLRVIHKPVWYVAVYERHATIERTQDSQPCFSRREVWRVDALDGSVTRATYDDAAAGDDPCLPIRLGTERDLRPAPPP